MEYSGLLMANIHHYAEGSFPPSRWLYKPVGPAQLVQQEQSGSFGPGELDELLTEGERDIERGDVLDADEAFAELRRLSAERRSKAG